MSEMQTRIYNLIMGQLKYGNESAVDALAKDILEAMRPEFERIKAAYSPRDDDVVWVDDRTPLPQFVDSIMNTIA